MSEEKKYDRNYRESSVKLALKTGIKRAIRSGTKVPYGTAGCKERRRLPLHRNILETKYVLVCYNDIWYHVYVRRHYSHSAPVFISGKSGVTLSVKLQRSAFPLVLRSVFMYSARLIIVFSRRFFSSGVDCA